MVASDFRLTDEQERQALFWRARTGVVVHPSLIVHKALRVLGRKVSDLVDDLEWSEAKRSDVFDGVACYTDELACELRDLFGFGIWFLEHCAHHRASVQGAEDAPVVEGGWEQGEFRVGDRKVEHLLRPLPPEDAGSDEAVDHPDHYGGADDPYETIKVIEAWGLSFHLGNVVKYVSRAGKKGDAVEDLKKALWYLARAIEVES